MSQILSLENGRVKVVELGDSPLVPYFIPSGGVFLVPENKQALFAMDVDIEGLLIIDGYLIEVG